ncbi:PAS domain S-box protein [Oscillatoria sp. FACHB-1407]|nr:PAS domain S-box protein [Oscillatoria sp. FACHB-1407]
MQYFKTFRLRSWIPILLGMLTTIAVFVVWQQLLIQEELQIKRLVQQQVDIVEVELTHELSAHVSVLQRMAKHWRASEETAQPIWEIAALSNIENYPGLRAIAWIDSSHQVRWAVPPSEHRSLQHLVLSQRSHDHATLTRAQRLRQPSLTPAISLPHGEKDLLAYTPIFLGEEGVSGSDRLDGFILGVFRVDALLDQILLTSPNYHIQIYDSTGLIYGQAEILPSTASKTVVISAHGINWQVRVTPTSALIDGERSLLATVVLWGGLSFAWILVLLIYLGHQAQCQAQRSHIINQQLQAEIINRQQVAACLQASEERWQLALRGNNDGIWDWNVQTNEVFFSSRWKEMLGFADDEIANHLDEWAKRVHPDDLGWVMEAIQDHFAQKTPFYITEHRVLCKDGSYKWILDRGQALWDEAGNVIRMTGSHTDVTEHKQAEVALRESEAKYRDLVDHLNAGFVVHAPDTHILQCNSTACELLGLSMEQMLGKVAIDPSWRFLREDGSVMPVKEYPVNRVLATQAPFKNYVLGISRGTQSCVWVLVNAFPEFDADHRLKQIIVTFIDISKLKQAETDLREMAEVMENALSGISKLGSQGRYLYVNKAYADVMGYQPEDLIGLPWYQTAHAEDHPRLMTAYQQMLKDGKVEVEARGIRKDGSVFYEQLVMVAARDEQQNFIGHYCFMKDISDRKRAEEALEKELLQSKTLFNTSIDGIVVINPAGDVVQASSSFAHMLGYTIEEILALNVSDWDAQWTKEELQQIREEDIVPPVFETRHRRQDGSLYDVEISYNRVELDGEMMHFCICRDISDRKRNEADRRQAEQALQESEARFQAFMNHSPAAAWITDANGIIIYISQTYFRTFQPSLDDLIGKSIFDVYAPEIAKEFLANIQTVAQTQQVLEAVELAPRPDGSMGNFLVYKFPIPDDSGQMLIGGVAIDLTEQYCAKEALRQSESTKQAIIQAIPDLLIRMRADGGYVEFISNNTFSLIKPDHQKQGISIQEVLPQNLVEQRLHYTQQALTTNTTQVYEQEIWIEGNQCYEEVRIVPLIQNEVLVMVRNISDRKQAEIALQLSQERLQLALDASGDGLWDWNIETGEVYHSACYQELLGYQANELSLDLKGWEETIYPDDKKRVLSCLDAHLQNTSVKYTLDYRVRCKSGEWKWITDYGKVVAYNSQGKPSRMIGAYKDISDRKHKEVALRQAMEAAEAANLAKSAFLASMSHELRTPLNVILGFTQVMAHDASLTPNQREDLQTIRRSGDHLLSLINDVLDLSKIEAGHFTLDESSFDLISLLHTLRTMMTERAKSKRLQLKFYIASEVPQFMIADEQKLRQILLNLLSNAIKFTERGSVILRVTVKAWKSADTEKVTSEVLTPNPQPLRSVTLQFEVIDTGVGIAETEQRTIFDAFIQADAGRKSMSGTGLGLTISRKLLELMNGEISVQSVPNVGSKFTFTVPMSPVSGVDVFLGQCDRLVVGLTAGQPHHRILVVDDQPENRLVLVRLLTQLGLDVQEASNGQDAIRVWQEWQPDLIWMDIHMPSLDGYEATKQIRAMEQDKISIIIALTAQASQSDRTLALTAGCNDYISKPFREETLFLKLKEYLGLEYIYAEPHTLSHSSSPVALESPDESNLIDPTLFDQLPTDWLGTLEKAVVCGDDRAIANLVTQLPPEFAPLATQLVELADKFQFEDILHLIQKEDSL